MASYFVMFPQQEPAIGDGSFLQVLDSVRRSIDAQLNADMAEICGLWKISGHIRPWEK